MQPSPLSSAKGLGPFLRTHHPPDRCGTSYLLTALSIHGGPSAWLSVEQTCTEDVFTQSCQTVCAYKYSTCHSLPGPLEEFVVVLLLFPDPWDPTLLVPLMNEPRQVQVRYPFPGLSGNPAKLPASQPPRPSPLWQLLPPRLSDHITVALNCPQLSCLSFSL